MTTNTANHNQKISSVFKIEDILRGTYTPDKYGKVMIPMVLIRRFDCILEEKLREIQCVLEALPGKADEVVEKAVFHATKIPFYNQSGFSLAKVASEPQKIELNFNAYLKGFSKNVVDILQHLEFPKELNKLVKKDRKSVV